MENGLPVLPSVCKHKAWQTYLLVPISKPSVLITFFIWIGIDEWLSLSIRGRSSHNMHQHICFLSWFTFTLNVLCTLVLHPKSSDNLSFTSAKLMSLMHFHFWCHSIQFHFPLWILVFIAKAIWWEFIICFSTTSNWWCCSLLMHGTGLAHKQKCLVWK